MRIGIAQWALGPDREASIQKAADLGLAAIHIDLDENTIFSSNQSVARRYSLAARQAGIAITAVAVDGTLVAQRDPDVIRRAVDAAREMAVPLIFVTSFGETQIRTQNDLLRTADCLRDFCIRADNDDITVASENSLGAEETEGLVRAVSHSRFRILFDCYNPRLFGHDPSALLRGIHKHLSDQVHAKDGRGGRMGNIALGTGDGALSNTLRTLRKLDFRGDIILENDYTIEAEARVRQDIRLLLEGWDLSGSDAAT